MGTKAAQRIEFNKTNIKAIKTPTKGRIYVYDTAVPTLAICVTATGSKTFYWCKWSSGRPVRIKIGRVAEIAIGDARDIAIEMSAIAARGENPQDAVRPRSQEPTLSELFKTYMDRLIRPHRKPRTVAEYERIFEVHLKKKFGNRRISEIEPSDIAALHLRIGTEQKKPVCANRVRDLLCAVFNKVEELYGIELPNPTRRVRRYKENSRDRFLQPDELPRFFKALSEETNAVMRHFFLLCLFTGARRTNVLMMMWADLDLELGVWQLDTKTGRKTLPLSSQALELLRHLKASATGPYVLPGPSGKPIQNPWYKWDEIRKRAGLSDLRMHDLRRSLGSWQAINGSSLSIIGKSLGHAKPQATAIYARLSLDPVRASAAMGRAAAGAA